MKTIRIRAWAIVDPSGAVVTNCFGAHRLFIDKPTRGELDKEEQRIVPVLVTIAAAKTRKAQRAKRGRK